MQVRIAILSSRSNAYGAALCSSTLVSELRTSSLGPKKYYELYMAVFDALRHLSIYLRENHPVNHLADLYELVQYAGGTPSTGAFAGRTDGDRIQAILCHDSIS